MINEYLLAPNFDLPPPPGGPVQLGQILDDADEPRYPLNVDDVVNPLDSKSYKRTAKGVAASRSQLATKEFKAWARLASLVPIGGGAEASSKKSSTDLFVIKSIETSYFLPSKAYLQASFDASEDVSRYIQGGFWSKDVYMITGLKVARGGSVYRIASDAAKGLIDGSIDLTQLDVPLETGIKLGKEAVTGEVTRITSLEPFILAYQVRKIIYKKGRPTKTVAHNRGAMFDNENPDKNEDDIIVEGLDEDDVVPENRRVSKSWVWMNSDTGDDADEDRIWCSTD